MDDLFQSFATAGHGTHASARPKANITTQQGAAFGAAFNATLAARAEAPPDASSQAMSGSELDPNPELAGTEDGPHSQAPQGAEANAPSVISGDTDAPIRTGSAFEGPNTSPVNPNGPDADTSLSPSSTGQTPENPLPASPANIAINAQLANLGKEAILPAPARSTASSAPQTLPVASIQPKVAPSRQIADGPLVLPTSQVMDEAVRVLPTGPLTIPTSTRGGSEALPLTIPTSTRGGSDALPLTIPTSTRGGSDALPLTIPTSTRGGSDALPLTIPTSTRGGSDALPLTIPTSTRSGSDTLPLTIPSSTRGGSETAPLTIPTSTVRTAIPTGPQTLPVADAATPPLSRESGGAHALTSPVAPSALLPFGPSTTGLKSADTAAANPASLPSGGANDMPHALSFQITSPSTSSASSGVFPQPPNQSAPTPLQNAGLQAATPPVPSAAQHAAPTTSVQAFGVPVPPAQTAQSQLIAQRSAPASDAPSVRDALPMRTGGWTIPAAASPAPYITAPPPLQAQSAPIVTGGLSDLLASALPDLQVSLQATLSNLSSTALTPTTSVLAHAPSATAQVIAQQISAAMSNASGDTDAPLELALDPPELGRVRMQMTEIAGVMTLMIHTERPETAELMRRHLDLLAQEFSQAGLDAPNVQISQEGADQQGQGQAETSPEHAATAASEPNAPSPPSYRTASGGLDLRL